MKIEYAKRSIAATQAGLSHTCEKMSAQAEL